jgi:formamidopyrimidine-DNA glycosylase
VPELPEAETIARTLAPHVSGRRIRLLRFFALRARRGPMPDLAGRRVLRPWRYGKQVVLELEGGLLMVRLGMTGSLRWRGPIGPYTRALIELDEGWITFDDIRQFGSLGWATELACSLGPDPLEVSEAEFCARLKRRSARLKALLLDQRFLRGLGNIYADEILFAAGIHPLTPARRLGAERAGRLYRAMRDVLERAIAAGGSSISDYVDADGRPGTFQHFHQVYGRAGRSCFRCGHRLRRILVAQRGSHFCPRCQNY